MDFGLTDEQDQLAAAERAWLTRNDPIARVRATLDSAAVTVDPAAVAHAAESGLLALLTPEMGGTHVDLAVVTEEHGYAASSLPIADLSIATWLLDRVGSPAEDGSWRSGAWSVSHSSRRRAAPGGSTSPVPMAADMDSVAVTGSSTTASTSPCLIAPDDVGYDDAGPHPVLGAAAPRRDDRRLDGVARRERSTCCATRWRCTGRSTRWARRPGCST